MRIVVFGGSGMLGSDLLATQPANVELVCPGSGACDIADQATVHACLESYRPDVVINAAAYTAVDAAESDEQACFAVNAIGAGIVAAASSRVGARTIYLSTDYVFDGIAKHPYTVDYPTNPRSVYGRSKREGEVRTLKHGGEHAVVLRTSWLYGQHGRNFVTGMLARMQQGQALRIVSDQKGAPTWTRGLAEAVWAIAGRAEVQGIHHWSDAGECSWYELAVAIQEAALALGLLAAPVEITPVGTQDYPTPAARPQYSVLDTGPTGELLGMRPNPWRESLRRMLATLEA